MPDEKLVHVVLCGSKDEECQEECQESESFQIVVNEHPLTVSVRIGLTTLDRKAADAVTG